jgi:phosphoribosyl-ATP pyrophosphohydrolase/phosphoribosyl-AMP cyclohydrolase/histidinol dehydrogenase
MTSLPYPSFVSQNPVDATASRAALVAVGRCRIQPEHATEEYRSIVAKNVDQAVVDLVHHNNDNDNDTNEQLDEQARKKLKKQYMKQGIAAAVTYLTVQQQLDVSVVHVQVMVEADDIIKSDGCLAACLLDAGCAAVVVDGTNLAALDAAKVPADRLMAHFQYPCLVEDMIKAKEFCGSMSVELTVSDDITVAKILEIVNSVPDCEVTVMFRPSDCKALLNDTDLASLVGAVSKESKEGAGTISLIDPTAEQLGLSYAACMKTDRPDGLYTTVVCTRNGEALGLVYSSKESIVAALQTGRGVYYSRSRQGLWRKGDTSGHFQTLHRLDVDCDGDALRFTVTQRGDDHAAFCHLNTLTCWGAPVGLRHLEETLQDRLASAPEGSYTKRLFQDPELLRDKLVEEAQELSEADTPAHVAEELADVLYFAMVRAVKAGVSMDDAVAELDRRSRKVTRRQGDSKAFRIAAGKEILEKEDK